MVILKDINANQTIHFITKALPWDTFQITDEQTKEVYTIENFTFTIGDYTTALTKNFNGIIKQNRSYTMELSRYSNGKVVFRDKIFCTNQSSLESYRVTAGKFTEHTTNNDFIIYE
jgi:hypothetical protein